ncbi:MAG TPA: PIG-L family deacetylase [Solirubrobacteraceae bacterium]|nr:PIG-L family deacetylase [Solirubrobacteraceae bacterium]
MSHSRLRSLQGLPRELYRRSRVASRARAESRLEPRLRFEHDAPQLLLSPHWDDAVLSCWNLLERKGELNVVNLFAGIPSPGRAGTWEAVCGARDSSERARTRIAEDARALARAGREPLGLALLDAKYRGRRADVDLNALDRALSEAVPSASRVYVPAGIGAHPDHVSARDYGRLLLRSGMPVTLYAELPYCIFHGWPSWVDGSPPVPTRNVDAYWQSFLAGVPEMPALRSADVQRLHGSASVAKLEAIQCYETSLNYSVKRLLADPALHGFEVHWRLTGPAADSSPAA